jgi:hypothetical protein
MKESPLPKNVFHDINKFPKGYGILVFTISISRMDNGTGQDPAQCLEHIKHFSPSKISEPKVGLNVVYGDFLYMHSQEKASSLKNKFTSMVLRHKNQFTTLVHKEYDRFQIQQAFSFEVWNQLYLNYNGDFYSDYQLFKKKALEDERFVSCLQDDAHFCGRELTDEQIDFFLEENFIFYLLNNMKISFPNEYVQGREEWVLYCYPGFPLKSTIYTFHSNPMNFGKSKNLYQNCTYDLEAKKLIDFTRIDLDTYNYSYEE